MRSEAAGLSVLWRYCSSGHDCDEKLRATVEELSEAEAADTPARPAAPDPELQALMDADEAERT